MKVVEKKKKYKRIADTCFGCEFASIILPFAIMIIVNWDKCFVEQSGTKMALACILSIVLMFFAIWLTAKKKFNGSYITLVFGWATLTAIFFLLGELINDLAVIMLIGLIGVVGAFVLDEVSKNYYKKSDEVEVAIKEAEKQSMVEQYKEEKKQEKNDGELLG